MYDVLAVGELNSDIIIDLTVKPTLGKEILARDGQIALGSSTALCASGLARLGMHVAFLGRIGKDVLGDFVLEALTSYGIDTSHVIQDQCATTGFTVALSYPADRALITVAGAISDLVLSDIPDHVLQQSRHLHVASLFLQHGMRNGWIDLACRAKALGLTVSSDVGWDPTEQWEMDLSQFLSHVDVFLPSEGEITAWADCPSIESAVEKLDNRRTAIVVKRGEMGVIARYRAKTYYQRAYPVQVRDTTGVGDAFNSGFLWAFLTSHSIEEALRYGAACGALCASGYSGTAGFSSLEHVDSLLKGDPHADALE